MTEAPEQTIRQYLDDHGGAVRVPLHNLLTSWGVDDEDREARGHIAAALREAGVNIDPPLDDLDPHDEVGLSVDAEPVAGPGEPAADDAEAAPAEPSQGDGGGAAPGWYPDPEDASRSRYWDGEQWSDYRHPHGDGAPAGFYADPTGQAGWRWWDGASWGEPAPG